MGGYAPSAGVVFIDLEPENPQFVHWKNRLPSTVAHELNHAARWRTVGYGPTFLETLVSEGLATVYEAQMTNQVPPYARANRNFRNCGARLYPCWIAPTTGTQLGSLGKDIFPAGRDTA